MKRLWIVLLLAACVAPLSFNNKSNPASSPQATPFPKTMTASIQQELEAAILKAAKADLESTYPVPVFDVRVENITLSEDGQFATAWLVPVNPQTGEAIPTEPGLALATWNGESWVIHLPSDPGWQAALASVPLDVLPGEVQEQWLSLENVPHAPQTPRAALEGYLLPWAEGETVYLSRSVAHDGSFPTGNAHYSFDFYISKTMYNLHASKAGTVWAFKDTVPNDDHGDVNFIVLQDTTTSPVTYQLYMHLAQNSIPPELKTIGEPVVQGQFIGVADNTGQSTGHHLHFQVETEPYWQGYWGKSVDIIFGDVDINGGRPRVDIDIPYCDWSGDVCNQTRSYYVSGNTVREPADLPRGDITAPQNGITLNASSLTLSGWASDDKGIASARFMANFDDTWQFIGPTFTSSPFSFNWNVCADQVPDGPVSLSLQIQDIEGNLSRGLPGLRHLVKQYDCGAPQPACVPNADQVAIFSDVGYAGKCALFNTGDYQEGSQLGNVGDDEAESILVGTNVLATFYNDDDLTGRGETFAQDDSSLKDNRTGSNTLSSLHVQPRSQAPAAPRLSFPANGDDSFTADDSLGLAWEDGGGATEFKVKLDGVEKSWQLDTVLHTGQLSTGSHSWQVKGRNAAGEGPWSSSFSFNIQAGEAVGDERTAPFTDDMEDGSNGWSNSSNWDQTDQENHSGGGSVSWGYEPSGASVGYSTGEPHAGVLTAPPVTIPASGTYYLRFYYLYETESPGRQWDRRWVQISADNGPFQDVLQFSDDPPNLWLESSALNLDAYKGKTIRVRFLFETLDANLNAYKGWFIDDFSITTDAPAACTDPGEPNDSPATAKVISVNSSFDGYICPGGDMDFFKFSATAGDQVGISTQAKANGSDLDTYVFLLDTDGRSVLAENDDIETGVNTDSFASFRLPRSGDYYIKLRAWNHPSVGGSSYPYTLSLLDESERPTIAIVSPPGGTFLPGEQVDIAASAQDSPPQNPSLPQGISRVDFFWHSGEWLASDWTFLGSDWVGDPNWSFSFDTSTLTDQKDIAFYAQAYDWAGNASGAAIWGMAMDRTPPKTSLKPILGGQDSTAVLLEWSASDNTAGLGSFDFQSQEDSGAWQDTLLGVGGDLRQAWAVVEAGQTTGFRMRGVDRVGNTESYPSSAEASTRVRTNFCDDPDKWENDNSSGSANTASGVVSIQEHNFCNPQSGSSYLNDQDWVKISVKGGEQLIANAQPLYGATAAVLRLYASNGTTLLAQSAASGFGEVAQLIWEAPSNSTVYLQVTHLDGQVAGNDVGYKLILLNGYHSFMPLIKK